MELDLTIGLLRYCPNLLGLGSVSLKMMAIK